MIWMGCINRLHLDAIRTLFVPDLRQGQPRSHLCSIRKLEFDCVISEPKARHFFEKT